MTIKADFHIHSTHSADGHDTPETIILQAISLGLTHICFTEHCDFDFPRADAPKFEVNVSPYFADLEQLQKKYEKRIKVLKGVELGLDPKFANRCQQKVQDFDFDFVLGSAHVVDLIDPTQPCYWEDKTETEGIEKYFQAIINSVKSFSNFDSFGHFDYVVRYSPTKNKNYSYLKFSELIDEALKAIINAGKIIEINSAGFRYNLGMAHPHPDVLRRYKELGGEAVTVGSDSHYAKDLTRDFDLVRDFLLSLGFKYYTVFEKRIPEYIKL